MEPCYHDCQVRGHGQVHTHNTMGQLMVHHLVTSLTMINIRIVFVFVTLTLRLCEGFVILDPDTENIDYKSGYKIVSINGESLEKSQSFREITSEEEYSKDDVEFNSLIPALRKGLKKVKFSLNYSIFGCLNNDVFREGFLIKLISKD